MKIGQTIIHRFDLFQSNLQNSNVIAILNEKGFYWIYCFPFLQRFTGTKLTSTIQVLYRGHFLLLRSKKLKARQSLIDRLDQENMVKASRKKKSKLFTVVKSKIYICRTLLLRSILKTIERNPIYSGTI